MPSPRWQRRDAVDNRIQSNPPRRGRGEGTTPGVRPLRHRQNRHRPPLQRRARRARGAARVHNNVLTGRPCTFCTRPDPWRAVWCRRGRWGAGERAGQPDGRLLQHTPTAATSKERARASYSQASPRTDRPTASTRTEFRRQAQGAVARRTLSSNGHGTVIRFWMARGTDTLACASLGRSDENTRRVASGPRLVPARPVPAFQGNEFRKCVEMNRRKGWTNNRTRTFSRGVCLLLNEVGVFCCFVTQ
jgi:hypothetical protein